MILFANGNKEKARMNKRIRKWTRELIDVAKNSKDDWNYISHFFAKRDLNSGESTIGNKFMDFLTENKLVSTFWSFDDKELMSSFEK